MSTKYQEHTVSPDTPMPKGYGFLRKGNPYLTALCRRKTHEARKPLYVVKSRSKPQGLRAPRGIIAQALADECTTRSRRRGAVEKKDAASQEALADAILGLFPSIPPRDLAAILKRTLKKRSGRVGRSARLDAESKARLAVQAHVRHCHTRYDGLMTAKGNDRETARRAVRAEMARVLARWRGGGAKKTAASSLPLGGGDDVPFG